MFKILLSKRHSFYMVAILLMLPLIISCNSNNVTSSSNPNVSTIAGRVVEPFPSNSGTSGNSNVGGATIQLDQVKSDGSLEVVSNKDVQTKTDGSFTITTDLDGASNLIVMAKKNGIKYESVISSQVLKGLTIASQPITKVTTAQANVYRNVEAMVQGTTQVASYPDIQMIINVNTGKSIYGDSTAYNTVAKGIINWEQAHNMALTSSFIGATSGQIKSLEQYKHGSTAQLQRSLYTAGSDTNAFNSIYNSYYQQIFGDYLNSGISLPHYIEVRTIATTALAHNINNLNSSGAFNIQQNDIGITSVALGYTNQSEFQNLGASSAVIDSSLSALQTFQQNLVSATSIDSIKSSFKQLHNVNINLLKNMYPNQAGAIDTVDADINGPNGLRSQLNAQIKNTSDPKTIVDAYITFFKGISDLMKNKTTLSSSGSLQNATDIVAINNIY